MPSNFNSEQTCNQKSTSKKLAFYIILLIPLLLFGVYVYNLVYNHLAASNRTELICDFCGTHFLGKAFFDYSDAINSDSILILCPNCSPSGDVELIGIMVPYGS